MTFNELTEWYLDQPDRKSKKFYKTIQYNLNSFNHDFGSTIIGYLRPIDLKNYQSKRKSEGKSDSYIDQEIGAARTMIRMVYDNDIISLEPVMVFSKVKKLLKKNSNALYKVLLKKSLAIFTTIMYSFTPASQGGGYTSRTHSGL